MKTKLKLIKKENLIYTVPLPERLNWATSGMVMIIYHRGEYMYVPGKFTFGKDTLYTEDELLMIVEELKRLNKGL
ncbi:MAG: hypothetical protein DRP42_04250 [Tenericutes bacterium]|nr:MAG: hypothetical protein DRP42_04250 [Mycoplasmatota bacterium]